MKENGANMPQEDDVELPPKLAQGVFGGNAAGGSSRSARLAENDPIADAGDGRSRQATSAGCRESEELGGAASRSGACEGKQRPKDVLAAARATIAERGLADANTPVLLMVSGGSDSTALAYIARELADAEVIGPLAMLHVNHQLRPGAADEDEAFVAQLAELLAIPLFSCQIDVAGQARREGGNVEAVARRERYLAANEALASLCRHAAAPLADGRIFTAHTADDRVENFYMRSMVGTGPGGFRAMKYANGPVTRPLLDVGREDLRAYLAKREREGLPCACDAEGNLWREDATNAHTDRFRAYVRHEVIPHVKQRSPQLLEVLGRTMNLIADEDDMLENMASDLVKRHMAWTEAVPDRPPAYEEGGVLTPELGQQPAPLQRRAVVQVLQAMLGPDARVETASVDAVLAAWDHPGDAETKLRGGYVANIQGNLAISANKHGVRLEPMAVFRARRKK